jgi:GH24 family phage-related lysozyme (muramidase)
MPISDRALRLIIDFEGINQPGQWPGASSGITLGYGYDLGHVTPEQFERDWGACFTPEQKARLRGAIGKTGTAAAALAPRLADIKCNRADSARVLNEVSIPDYLERTRAAFPGVDALPADAQGALVSLVYNRGPGMTGESRREMRTIRELVPLGDLAGIARALREMKRLWEGKGLAGLLRRRDAEASLIEAALAPVARGMRRAPAPVVLGPVAKKAAARKAAAKKPAAKKPAKKAAVKQPAARKTAAKKTAAKKATAKKSAGGKAAAKRALAKKAAAKKPTARKVATKKSAARKVAAKKVAAKKAVAKKAAPRKPAAKKPAARKVAAGKRAAQGHVAARSAAKKAVVKKAVARKTATKKSAARAAVTHHVAARTASRRAPAKRGLIRRR